MKSVFKKSLVAATVLAAFLANAAFAAEPAANNQDNKPAVPLHCYTDGDNQHHFMRGHHKYRNLTEEQIKERQERRAQWQNMTAEQRQEAREQWRAERIKYREECMSKLSQSERAEVEKFLDQQKQNRENMRAQLQNMTPEQRKAIRANAPHRMGPGFHHMASATAQNK